jgi:hypothetical protein
MLSKKSFFKRMVFTKHFRTTNISEIKKASKSYMKVLIYIICSIYFPFRQKKKNWSDFFFFFIPVRDFNYLYYFYFYFFEQNYLYYSVMSVVTEKGRFLPTAHLRGLIDPIRIYKRFVIFFFSYIYILCP